MALFLLAKLVGDLHGITASRVCQLVKYYRTNGVYPAAEAWQPCCCRLSSLRLDILFVKATLRIGTKALEIYLREIKGFSIGNRTIHRILMEDSMTYPDPKKGICHRPWVRYEREFSLEAVHMDRHVSKFNGKRVCVVLNDASRMILAGKKFDAATTQNSISVLKLVYQADLPHGKTGEIITDHGSQLLASQWLDHCFGLQPCFYTNKRDCYGEANHVCEEHCRKMGIKHNLSNITIRKVMERWRDGSRCTKQFRTEFSSLDEMQIWYNTVMPHQRLDWNIMKTPDEAFIRKLRVNTENHSERQQKDNTEIPA